MALNKTIAVIAPSLILTLAISNFDCANMHPQNLQKGFIKDSVSVFSEKNLKEGISQQYNFDSTTLMFLGIYEDTIEVYIGAKFFRKFSAFKQDYLSSSSDFTGHSFRVKCYKKEQNITIRLLDQKKVIEFTIGNTHPLYTIQRYNQVWYINKRYNLELK